MHKLAVAASRGALVLQELSVNENGPVYVRLKGRKAGIVAWLLSLLGIDPTTILEITETKIDYVEGSLSGNVRHSIPIDAICNLGTGYLKPVMFCVGAIGNVILAIIGALLGGSSFSVLMFFGVAIFCAIAYYAGNVLMLYALPESGVGPIIGFKRSIIEGVSIDEEQANKIIAVIMTLIETGSDKQKQ